MYSMYVCMYVCIGTCCKRIAVTSTVDNLTGSLNSSDNTWAPMSKVTDMKSKRQFNFYHRKN